MNSSFSVLLSVYARENPAFLRESLKSIQSQTLLPEKVVIVQDGVLPESINQVLVEFKKMRPDLYHLVGYETNKGLGYSLNYGLQFIDTEYVARMDADDVAVPERFEIQMRYLTEHNNLDALGSWTLEFNLDPACPKRLKKVPEYHDEIALYAKFKNPMNHMTVVFRRSSVQNAGGYLPMPYFEDYYLWVRMLAQGMNFHNLSMPLVMARVGNDMVGKRHGLRYAQFEYNHFIQMKKIGLISTPGFVAAIALRLPLRLVPKKILSIFYSFALRKKN